MGVREAQEDHFQERLDVVSQDDEGTKGAALDVGDKQFSVMASGCHVQDGHLDEDCQLAGRGLCRSGGCCH